MTDILDRRQVVHEPDNVLARVSKQLSLLEKRDWQEWLIVAFTGIIIACGLFAIMFPAAFLGGKDLHFEISVPKELFLGLLVVLVLFNTYMVSRRIQTRRLREELISTTLQSELVRLQSFIDPLTEVYNRRSLDKMAGRFISHALRSKKPLTFALVDVDRFKEVNTRFGHLTGDFLLAQIAGLLKTSVRGCDAVVRYGGDEFLIIMSDASRDGAAQVVNRISSYVRDWNKGRHLEDFELGLSIGIAEWTDGQTLDEVLDQADKDMYALKVNR